MKGVMRFFPVAIMVSLIFVASVIVPSEATAETKTIWPSSFYAKNSNADYGQYPSSLTGSTSSQSYYWTTVQIPVGSRITKIIYYHRGESGGGSTTTEVTLRRVKMGFDEEDLVFLTSSDASGIIVPVESSSIASPVVAAGYLYWIKVTCYSDYAEMCGVKVLYK